MNAYIAKLNSAKRSRHFARAIFLPAMAKLRADMESCILGADAALPMRRAGDVPGNDLVGALRQLVDIVRRMDPDYLAAHGVPQTTDDEFGIALCRAEDALDELDGRL